MGLLGGGADSAGVVGVGSGSGVAAAVGGGVVAGCSTLAAAGCSVGAGASCAGGGAVVSPVCASALELAANARLPASKSERVARELCAANRPVARPNGRDDEWEEERVCM